MDNITLFGGNITGIAVGELATVKEVIRGLKTEIPNAKFAAFCENPALGKILDIEAVSNSISDWRRWLHIFMKTDLFVVPGGTSVFGSGTLARASQVILAKFLGKPIMLYGMSFKPPRTRKGRLFLQYVVLNCIDCVAVRDEGSLEALQKLGYGKKGFLTADPALTLESAPLQRVKEIATKIGLKRDMPLVVLSPRHFVYGLWHTFSKETIENYKVILAQVADFIVSELGQVLFIPFNTVPPDNDLETVGDIMGLMRKRSEVKMIDSRDYSPHEIAAVIREADLLLGTRHHSLVLAAGGYIPMVAINYEPKVYGFMKLIGQENLICEMEGLDYKDCIAKIDYAWSHRDLIKQEMVLKVEVLKKRAVLNAKLAKELLL